MKEIVIDEELTLVPYYPNYDETFTWYQDKDVCKQVDNIDHVYLPPKALKMVREWIEINRSELQIIWETQEFKKLPPLE